MKKFWIVISKNTENGYSVYLKDRDAKKVVLPNCDNLDHAFMFCAGLKEILGEISIVFDAKDPKGSYFDSGRTAASSFIARVKKFSIIISEIKKKGYVVYLKDEDATKEVLESCDKLDDVFMFCVGLKKELGEMPVMFDVKHLEEYHFKLGQEVARNLTNS